MAKTLRELEQEFAEASKSAEKTFNVLNGTGGRGGLEQAYEIAARNKAKNDKDPGSVRNFSLKEFNALKTRYDQAVRDYKTAQEAKNASNKALKNFKKEAGAEKEKATAVKVAESAYDKAVEKLTEAEAKFAGYKGQENYIAAYQAAKVAYQTAVDAGAKPKALPKEKVAIPEVKEEEKQLTPEEQAAEDKKTAVAFGQIKEQLADPKNKQLLIDVQKNLAKNFGYKGSTDGVWSIKFQDALTDAAENRVSLPKSLQGADLLRFIASPGVDFKGTGKGTGEPATTEYPTIFSSTDATKAINDVFEAELGRKATAAEMTELKPLLKAAQEKNPARYVTKIVGGKKVVTQTTGLDVGTFLLSTIKKIPTIKTEIDQRLSGKKSITLQDLQKTATANGLDLSVFGDDINSWVKRVDNGEDIDIFKNLIRQTAKIGLPDKVGKLLDEGVDLNAVYAPYKNLMAKVLEIDAGSIKLNDPTLRAAIGPDKEMPIYEFERALRRDPRWQYTDTARQEVSDTALGVLQDFGFMG
jgi:hypothetical protein